jgi:hypothetical protein
METRKWKEINFRELKPNTKYVLTCVQFDYTLATFVGYYVGECKNEDDYDYPHRLKFKKMRSIGDASVNVCDPLVLDFNESGQEFGREDWNFYDFDAFESCGK